MKKKSRIAALAAAAMFSMMAIAGCGREKDTIPYPDHYYVHTSADEEEKTENSDETAQPDDSLKPETIVSEKLDSKDAVEQKAQPTGQKTIHYFLDNSASIARSPEVIHIYSAATKCSAGYARRTFYGMGSEKNLVETSEELALAGKYGNGAPLDLLENGSLPCAADGVNILTTDLQSNTSSSRLGQWLVATGCKGFTFYVFEVPYNGSVEFQTYTSSTNLETVSVSDCSFEKKEFLMIVFGDNDLVQEFDGNFQSKLKSGETYDVCHTSLKEDGKTESSFLPLMSSRCFQGNLPNVTYTNNNYVFGMTQESVSNVAWTCDNTFVFRKSSNSVGRSKSAVKAVLYGVPEEPLPEIENAVVTEVLEYNSETKEYEPSGTEFVLDTEAYLNGFPAVVKEEGQNSKVYEKLRQDLGDNLAASGPVFVVTLQNENLPRGTYAVEAQITFAGGREAESLQNFAENHSAGLEEYSRALQEECQAKIADGVNSTSRFRYIGSKSDASVFCKLLDFERITDELLAAGAVTETDSRVLTVRVVIDN